MATRRRWLIVGTSSVLVVALLAMIADAAGGGDWPGWDEGLAVMLFPLGVPAAVGAGLAAAAGAPLWRQTAVVTAAVWCWGGVVFLAWLVLG
jgi:hypothetical protein